MFGEPGTGAHAFRIFDIAVADVGFVILAAAGISWLSGKSVILITMALFILGIFAHRVFCVRTTVDKILFPAAI